ncbi:MAG: Spi family protease inhibitor, partial [Betaproteobacteria bacterium]
MNTKKRSFEQSIKTQHEELMHHTHIVPCLIVVLELILTTLCSWSMPVSKQQAKDAGQRWINQNPNRVSHKGNKKVITTHEINIDNTQVQILNLEDEGFVVVLGDDSVNPVIAFSATGHANTNDNDPLMDLLKTHIPQHVKNGHAHAKNIRAEGWNVVATASATTTHTGTATNIDDDRVAPLIKTQWSQGQDSQTKNGIKTKDPVAFNYYTPPYGNGTWSNYYCGCVATAMAQLMYYHQWP